MSQRVAVGQPVGGATRYGAVVVLMAGGLALGLSGLLAPQVCLLTLILIVAVGVAVPRRIPWLVHDSPQRTGVALLALALLVLVTAMSGPAALTSGGLKGNLGLAAGELALPTVVPIGLLAALAAGALVAVALELSDRRGAQSALVLGIAILGLASVAAPGWHLLPVILLGWPAALFTLTGLASVDDPTVTWTPEVGDRPDDGPIRGPGRRPARSLVRWRLLPVFLAIILSCSVLAAAVMTGLVTGAEAGSWDSAGVTSRSEPARSTSDYLGGDLDLGTRGALSSEAFVQVPAGSPRLWRAGTLDLYTGRGWLTTLPPGGLPRLSAGALGELTVTSPPNQSPAPSPADQVRADRVRPLRSGPTEVLAPGQLISLTAPSLIGGSAYGAAGDRLTVMSGPSGPSRQAGLAGYEVRSRVFPLVDDASAASRLLAAGPVAGPAGQSGDDPRWTTLPRTVPDRVRQLGLRLVTGAPSRLAAVQTVEHELDRRMTYNLDSPVPPPGADAVDDVLFTSHSGFCEQFASAEVVLLRAAGVPARIAVGFAGGAPTAGGGLRTLRRSDAHAWVEVWFPGVGWASSDPTPAAPPSSAWWSSGWAAVRAVLIGPVAGIAVVLVVSLLAGPMVVRRRRPGALAESPPPVRRLDPDLAAAFARLEADLSARGRGRAPNETVAALARRLPAGALGQALAALERELYAPQPLTRAESLVAAAAIQRSVVALSTVHSKGRSSTDL